MHNPRTPTVVAFALAVGLAACTGTPPSAAPSAQPTVAPTPAPTATPTPTPTAAPAEVAAALLEDAVTTTVDAGTVDMETLVEFEGSTLIPAGTSLSAEGVAAFGDRRQLALSMDMSELGQGEIAMIIDDPVVWVKLTGPLGTQLAANGKWLRIDEDATSPMAAALRGAVSGPNDNSLGLFYLLGATDVANAGEEVIDGVPTTRVTATLDLEAALDKVPASVRDALVINIADIKEQGVDPVLESTTWIDADGLVRRQELVYALSSMQGGGTMRTTTNYTEHGAPLDLGIPDDDEVTDIDEVQP